MNAVRFLVVGLMFAGSVWAHESAALKDWPKGATPEEIGHRVAEEYLARPYQLFGPQRVIHYVETNAWVGSLRFAQATGDKALTTQLTARFDPLLGPARVLIPPALNVDYTVFGAVPLELFLETKDPRYLKLGVGLAEQQWTVPEKPAAPLSPEAQEGIAAGLSWHTRFWIDDMYMITMLQTQAFRATGDAKYLDRAAREAVAYLDKLQQPNGLFFHAPDAPFFWGRGNGWFAAGMSELLSALPEDHPQRARIMAGYRQMMATLLQHQDASGLWHQLVDDPESWTESSCTAMFTFAFITGVKKGWLPAETYGPAARKGWLAVVSLLNPDGRVRDVCSGLNKTPERKKYLEAVRLTGDLHGQGPILWCATALLR